MLRVLLGIIPVVLVVWALVDAITTDESKVLHLPKVVWVILILLFNVIGALAWLFAGKDRSGPEAGRRRPGRTPAPDDDPNFLDGLRQQQWEQEQRKRRARDETDGPGAG